MIKRILITLFFFLCSSVALHAQCSGSGATWSCASGTTSAQISSTLSSALDGATLTFANGSYTWSGNVQFSLAKGVTLICAGGGVCTVRSSGTVFSFPSGSSTHLYRISGFNFNPASAFMVWTCPAGGCSGTITQFRFDHNTVVAPDQSAIIALGENTAMQYVYGVIDHNTFSSSGSIQALISIGGLDSTTHPASPQGTVNNMFFEDNVITSTTMTNAGFGGVDGWGAGSALVFRHNSVTNNLVTAHEPGHGGGQQNWEIYNNHVTVNSGASGQGVSDGYRLIHHQGSNEEIFNNTFTSQTEPINGSALSITANYIDSCGAYPCPHQPGRDYASGMFVPIYAWNNRDTANGNKVPAASEAGDAVHVAPNRDYFDEVATFNGTTGVGFGTLANRPSTCTHSNSTYPTRTPQDDGHGGVGYFATDAGAQGTLFTCTATNTWTVAYQPYPYPHPLVTGGVTPPPPLAITTTSLPNVTVGAVFVAQLAANGGTAPYQWSATGMPAWLTLTAAGALSGTPSATDVGSVALSVKVADSVGANALTNLSFQVSAQQPVVITVAPVTVTLVTGATQQFTATITGSTSTAAAWSASCGMISASGLFTAPSVAGSCTVTATVVADTTKSAIAAVTVNLPPPPSTTSTFGNTSTGTTTDSGDSNAPMIGRFVSGPTGGSAVSISVYVATPLSAAPNNQFQVALYSDNNGNPGTLIAKSASGTLTGNAWNTASIAGVIAPNTNYWLAYNTNGTSTSVNNLRFGGNGKSCWKLSTAFGTWPSPFTTSGCSTAAITEYLTYSTAAPPVSVVVSPKSISVQVGGIQQFTATVSNTSKTGVTWTASCGTIDSNGLYTAPLTTGSCSVTATSIADQTKADSATVMVTPPPPTLSMTCAGLVCTLAPQNMPSGTQINVSASGGGVQATASVSTP